jgi:hypothetical protein
MPAKVRTRNDEDFLLQRLLLGTKKHLTAPLSLRGKKWTPDDLIALFQGVLDAGKELNLARAAYRGKVAERRARLAAARTVWMDLHDYLAATHGAGAAALIDFGWESQKPKQPTTETKAQAVIKRRATRAVRHTMGKRQRKKVKA